MIELVNRETGELLDTDSVPGLAQVAALHDERLEQLALAVEELVEGGAGSFGDSRGPIVWDRLTPHEATRIWGELASWVGWLRDRYPLAHQIPLCWWRHSELVEEISALWMAWRDAYVEKGAPLTGGADWHARWLPEFLRRLGAGGWNVACEADHRPVVSSLYDARSVDDPDAFARETSVRPMQGPLNEEENFMDASTMQDALDTGVAVRLGHLPDSPVRIGDGFWTPAAGRWIAVEDEQTIEFLLDAHRRLALAEVAQGEAEQP
jgi:hypothetical protein